MKKQILSTLNALTLRHKAEAASAGLPALMAAAEKAVTTLYHGDHRQRRSGSGENFWQFREYDSSDRPQDIDWRQSAKGDHVYTRQKERQTAQTILFWAQNDRGMAMKTAKARQSKYETAAIFSLALGLLLTRAGEHIAPLQEPNRAGRNDLALQRLGDMLCRRPATLPPGPAVPVAHQLPKRASLILAGDFMQPAEELEITLSVLAAKARHGLLVQILDPAELELPFNGRVIFRPFNDTMDIPIANVPSIREAYKERLRNHIDAVHDLARHHGYGHIVCSTADDIRPALSAAWQALAPLQRYEAGT
ncbi:MAG: hypothetical protein JWO78_1619 [Micavibrio sp.]|nr:hypothetical protein [Micavibrio sp.]